MIDRFSDKRAAVEGKMTDFRNINTKLQHLSPKEREAITIATKKLTNRALKKR